MQSTEFWDYILGSKWNSWFCNCVYKSWKYTPMAPLPKKVAPPTSPAAIGHSELDDNKKLCVQLITPSLPDAINTNMLLSEASNLPKHYRPWTQNAGATRFFISMVTCLYTLIITIFALIVELSPTWRTDIHIAETIFFMFMYGTGLIYFTYCYLFMIYPGPINFVIMKLSQLPRMEKLQRFLIIRSNHSGEGAGTLYLRLGALFFGSLGTVLFGLEIFLCTETEGCKEGTVIAKQVVAMIFTFVQMHFIFCNSKIAIMGSKKISKLGMMHLVAVNLWTWFRFVLAKQEAKANKKKKGYDTTPYPDVDSSSSSEEEGDIVHVATGMLKELANETIEAILTPVTAETDVETTTESKKLLAASFGSVRLVSLEHFGDLATFLTTCIVEYSIIGAAVMFIIWSSIDGDHHSTATPVKRKHRMRVDCSRSSTGLFAGIVFLIASFVSMGVYSIFSDMKETHEAVVVFGIVDLVLFCISLAACIYGMWRMRLLQYRLHAHGEVIDEILLILGLVGEIIYCCIGIDIFIATWRHKECTDRSLLSIFMFMARLCQVVAQTAFILTVSRLRCLSPATMKLKPGKQTITFLLVANITLFVFQTFESMKSSYGINELAGNTYMTIIYAVGPLLVFFRFHSSACLAEVWKHTYSIKEHSNTVTPFAHSTLTINTAEEHFEP